MTEQWMHIMIEVPAEEGEDILTQLKEEGGFRDIDFCELQRPDFARVSWGPSEPRTESGYGPSTVAYPEDPFE